MALVNFPASGSCYKYGDHMSYTGNVAVTIYGVQCASWTLHGYSNADFPDNSVQAASNYCRNPGNEETGPWCYDINDNMGHCSVFFCSTAGRCSLSSLLITVVTITNTYQHFIGCVWDSGSMKEHRIHENCGSAKFFTTMNCFPVFTQTHTLFIEHTV